MTPSTVVEAGDVVRSTHRVVSVTGVNNLGAWYQLICQLLYLVSGQAVAGWRVRANC